MIKEVAVTEKVTFCDIENCNEKAINLKSKKDKDICYEHAKEKHCCVWEEKIDFYPTYQDGYYVVSKKDICVEYGIICYGTRNKQETFNFFNKLELFNFVFNICSLFT